FFSIGDEGLADACARARAIGFAGKAAIHPSHIAAIRDRFAPSAEDLAEARRILDAAPKGVGVRDGRMVDEAMVKWARRITTHET
ncbi:MAG: HpcH/HpaI aldolase/citrate lyase family protein, partial [Sphingomonadales bacterium]